MTQQQYLNHIADCETSITMYIGVPELSGIVSEYMFGYKKTAYATLCIHWYFGAPNRIMYISHYIKNVMVNGLLTAVWAYQYRMAFKREITTLISLEAHSHNMLSYPETTRELVRFGQRIVDNNYRLFWDDGAEMIWVADDEEIYIDELMEDELARELASGGDDMREINHMVIR